MFIYPHEGRRRCRDGAFSDIKNDRKLRLEHTLVQNRGNVRTWSDKKKNDFRTV